MTENSKKVKVGGSKLLANMDHFKKWQQGGNPGPLSVEVGCVYGCNLACAHCAGQQYSDYQKIKCLDDKQAFNNFLSDFKEMGGQEVFFAGTGEPTLNPHLADWTTYGRNIGLDMALSTNAIVFKNDLMEKLVDSMSWIRFSVSAGDPESYAKIHNCSQGTFDKVIRNLEVAVKYRDRNKLKAKLTILFVILDLNWKTLNNLIRIHKEIGTDLLILRNAILEKDSKVKHCQEEMEESLKEMEKDEKVEVRWDTFRPVNKCMWTKCHGINFRTIMNQDGDLFTCARQYHQDSVYGNIIKDRLVDIWSSEKKKKVFTDVERGNMIPTCGQMCHAARDNMFIAEYLNG